MSAPPHLRQISIPNITNKLNELSEIIRSHRRSEATNTLESALTKLINELESINEKALNEGFLTADQNVLLVQWFCARRSATNIKEARSRRITRAGNRYDEKNRVIREIKVLCGIPEA